MAIDTQEERRAVLLGTALPVADSVIRAEDRGLMAWVFPVTGETGTGGPAGVAAADGWVAGVSTASCFVAGAGYAAATEGYVAGAMAVQV